MRQPSTTRRSSLRSPRASCSNRRCRTPSSCRTRIIWRRPTPACRNGGIKYSRDDAADWAIVDFDPTPRARTAECDVMSRIDSYISLHFRDLPARPSGGREDFVEERRPVRRMRGVQRDAEAARAPEPAARGPHIPVLLNLKRADWDKNIDGLQKGSRLGRILSAVATE